VSTDPALENPKISGEFQITVQRAGLGELQAQFEEPSSPSLRPETGISGIPLAN
jgi:hypothetical protein